MYIWDSAKNLINQSKHGISFDEARDAIFEGPNLIVNNVARQNGEPRHAIIGKFNGKYYVGIFTIRAEGIRIISVRRARHEEEKQAKEKGL
ncbi:MAG: BrnT family toxin [Deltaproteobacteria bacterium]|nr:BrnT family toxin [Deltaproteobacteria bacterium]